MTARATAERRPGRARTRLRATFARVPRAAWICALVAFLNATAWGIVVPAFQVPDEQVHYAYTEYLVQHHRPPAARPHDTQSSSENAALAALKFREMRFSPENGTIWSASQQAELQAALHQDADRSNGNGGGKEVAPEPPLFYALQAVPYTIASGGTVLARLQLMRLLSALLAGTTVLIFYLLARGFRRGLTRGLAVAIGAATAVALQAKFNAFGLVPGVVLGLLVMSAGRERTLRPRTLALPALALGIAVAPMLLEMALNATVWDRPTVGATASNFRTSTIHPAPGAALSYLWQFYIVPLPGMTPYLEGVPFLDLWERGFVGWFGWIDSSFRPLVYDLALVPIGAVVLLAARTLFVGRRRVPPRLWELLTYATLAAALMVFVAMASYISYLRYHESVAQTRYLFPLLPLYGALLALAARGAGRRWVPVLGTAIVALAIGHSLFSQLLVLARYYA